MQHHKADQVHEEDEELIETTTLGFRKEKSDNDTSWLLWLNMTHQERIRILKPI